MNFISRIGGPGFALLLLAVNSWADTADQMSPELRLEQLDQYPHAELINSSSKEVLDHEVGLGAMQKTSGSWGFKSSERVNGSLQVYTWQIVDGFTSQEVMETLVAAVVAEGSSELLFECDGRSCGQGVQWANRAFGQRILYGREDLQRYRVYAIDGAENYRLLIYAAARTADRQYLHVELLRLADAQQQQP